MITKEVTDGGNMVTTLLSGDISGQEVLDDFFAMLKLNDQINPAGFAHLYDMSQVISIAMDENDVRRITSLGITNRINKMDVCTAIVVTNPDSRKLALLHKDLSNALGLKRVEVFGNQEDALNWLKSEKQE